jgi:hypothetical protein
VSKFYPVCRQAGMDKAKNVPPLAGYLEGTTSRFLKKGGINAVQNKIGRLQPIDGSLNIL